MKYRLAKLSDLKDIVRIHFDVRDFYSTGIFASLNKQFLNRYYKIILNDKNQIVVCAVDEEDNIQGFCSATLDVEKQFKNIRAHKFSLTIASLSSIISTPSLLKKLLTRYNSTTQKSKQKFITSKGPRLEYWAWSISKKDPVSSLEMHETLLNILKTLGVGDLNFEVDSVNKKILLFHKYNGAEILESINLPDGRKRFLMRYNLLKRK